MGLERALTQIILTQLFYAKYTRYWGKKKKTTTLRDKREKCHLSWETPTQSTKDPKAGPEGEVVQERYGLEITALLHDERG